MAELHVQPKKKSSILPWILLALGLAALIWYLTRDKNVDNAVINSDTTTTTVQPATDTTMRTNTQ
jgi:hypothetical protein